MKEDAYRAWLIKTKPDSDSKDRVVSDHLSRCRRIEKCLKVDLDEEYLNDKGKNLLSLITYPADKIINGSVTFTLFHFKNTKTNALKASLSTLCTAAKDYFAFKNSIT